MALVAAGCAVRVRDSGFAKAQAAVEEALRRRPDPTLVAEVSVEFELGCREGDAAACSSLGAVFEAGIDRPRNMVAAKTLYEKACTGGNQRSCVNLGRLLLNATPPPGQSIRRQVAADLFRGACYSKEWTGCYQLGLLQRTDRTGADALTLFDVACTNGVGEACVELATIHRENGNSDKARSLIVIACRYGQLAACFEAPGQPITPATVNNPALAARE